MAGNKTLNQYNISTEDKLRPLISKRKSYVRSTFRNKQEFSTIQ